MGLAKVLGRAAMPAFAVLAGYSTLKFAYHNKTLDKVGELAWSQHSSLPGTEIPLRQRTLGFEYGEVAVKAFNAFFYPVISGEMPELSLQAFHFLGQFASLWLLLQVECRRLAIVWQPISFAIVLGLLLENVGFAIVLPIWLMLQMGYSHALNSNESTRTKQTSIIAHPTEIKELPWSVLLGLGVPVAMILLTKPNVESPWWASQQVWVAVRMLHPLWTGIIQSILGFARETIVGRPSFGSATERNQKCLAGHRHIYQCALNVAMVTHITTMTISLTPYFMPALFESWVAARLNLVNLFWPAKFWDEHVVEVSLAEGVFKLLQWDEFIGLAAALVWAIATHRASLANEDSAPSFTSTILKAAMYTVVGGPAAAVVALMRERDSILLYVDSAVPASEQRAASVERRPGSTRQVSVKAEHADAEPSRVKRLQGSQETDGRRRRQGNVEGGTVVVKRVEEVIHTSEE